MKSNIFKWLIIVLTIHIFSVMAGLLHGLNGKNEALWLAFVFAASYSVASAFIVYIANQKWLIFSYAIADGVAVIFYYFAATPDWLISVYFGVYTFGLIASTIYMNIKQKRKRNAKNIPSSNRKQANAKRRTTNKENGSIRPRQRRTVKNSKNNAPVS